MVSEKYTVLLNDNRTKTKDILVKYKFNSYSFTYNHFLGELWRFFLNGTVHINTF